VVSVLPRFSVTPSPALPVHTGGGPAGGHGQDVAGACCAETVDGSTAATAEKTKGTMDEEQKERQRFIDEKRGVHYLCHQGRLSRRATMTKKPGFLGLID